MIFISTYVVIINMDAPVAPQAPNPDCYFTHIEMTWIMFLREKTLYPMLLLNPERLTF